MLLGFRSAGPSEEFLLNVSPSKEAITCDICPDSSSLKFEVSTIEIGTIESIESVLQEKKIKKAYTHDVQRFNFKHFQKDLIVRKIKNTLSFPQLL
jgi:hypothetical protein